MKIGCHRPVLQSPVLLSLFMVIALEAGRTHAAPLTSAGSGMWTNPAVWSPNQVPSSADDVTIAAGHTITIAANTAIDVSSLTILTNGVLTHLTNSTTALGEKFKIILNVAGALTIDAGGQINADGRGYASGQGPAPGKANGGAGHGGIGGSRSLPSNGGTTYGSITSPTNFGSGGGYAGQWGGGAVQLTVSGATLLNGAITAEGSNNATANPYPYYGPSGGSVFLKTGTLAGKGLISVKSASLLPAGDSHGGGGRIAVILTGSTDIDAVRLTALSGTSTNATPRFGAAGTIYLEHTGHSPGQGKLLVDYNKMLPADPMGSLTLQNGLGYSSNDFAEFILTNGAVYALDTNDTLNISQTTLWIDPTNLASGFWLNGGRLIVPADFAFSNFFINITLNADFHPASSLTLGSNAILSINAPYTSACPITIQAKGLLTHLGNSTEALGELYKLNVTVPGNFTIEQGGQINVDGKGYVNQQGPGRPVTSNGRAGGSYGGIGGAEQGYPGTTYGSIVAPTNLGSAGVGATTAGGGAVRLDVGGTTTVNGVISANGTTLNYGGSGGSVFLTTAWLSGTGIVRASGSAPVGQFASGGGGRVAVILTNSTDFGSVKLQSYSSAGFSQGAGGTVYMEHLNHTPGQGRLVVDYNDIIPVGRTDNYASSRVLCTTLQNGSNASSYAFSEIILTNGGVYSLDTNDTLTLADSSTVRGDTADRNEGILLFGGTLDIPAGFTYSNYFIGIGATNSTFTPSPSLTVGTNATLKINVPFTLNCPLALAPGAILDHSPNITNEVCKVDLTVMGNMTIHSGALVNVDACGYHFIYGPGKPVSAPSGVGGSHGGVGGSRVAADVAGPTYGSITSPTNLGSGGSYGNSIVGEGAGGGAVKLLVTGTTTLYGAISALPGGTIYGGSGGSIFLTTGNLMGNGNIRASGLYSGWTLGGGGRIAVIVTNAHDFGQVSFQAIASKTDSGGVSCGGAGTVYLQTMDQEAGQGTVWIDASNRPSLMPTLISSNVTGTTVGSIIITNGAILWLGTNAALTVNGSWINRSVPVNTVKTNTGSFFALTNSTVILASTNDATISGSNTFYNLSCTSAVKTVSFTAGTTNTVLGQLALGGEATFKSTIDGSQWYLKLANEGTQQIGVVRVRDSNAGSGQLLMPARKSTDLGNNLNWLFIKSSGAVILIH
jgi:hypothetical protein